MCLSNLSGNNYVYACRILVLPSLVGEVFPSAVPSDDERDLKLVKVQGTNDC